MLLQIDFSNSHDSFISFGDSLSNFGHCALIGCLAFGAVAITRIHIRTQSLSCLLLVLEVCNVQTTFRKSYAANILVMSDLTVDHSFKVKLGWVNIKVLLSHLLSVLEVSNVQSQEAISP